jgi:catechol 2,3-dioxygenase-like lactoylglutathione lyase family enzyme
VGAPGTILTFFPWVRAAQGRNGTGMATECALAIPTGALHYWAERLTRYEVPFTGAIERNGETLLSFADPDGLPLTLTEVANDPREGWTKGAVPSDYAVRGVHGVTLSLAGSERTASLLTETMGFRPVASERGRLRYEAGAGNAGTFVDLLNAPSGQSGRGAAGTIHHIAWRTPDDDQQRAWRDLLLQAGYHVSPVMDRNYFHSIYYREPGGVLFEIATDPPGFAIDEPAEELGTHLLLPEWYEGAREEIEAALPPLRLPETEGV